MLGARLATWLAIAGALGAVVAQVLPWASLPGVTTSTGSIGLDRLNTITVLGYYLCWIGLLVLTGLVQAARPVTRRAAAGAAFGLVAALVMMLAGITRWILTYGSSGDSTGSGTSGDASTGISLRPGPGLFCAGLAVGLILASILLAVRRRGPVLSAALTGPAAAALADEPLDLTVVPTPPVDESLFARPDGL